MNGFLSKAWHKFRGWSIWVQVVVGLLALGIIGGLLTGETETEPTARPPEPTVQDDPVEESPPAEAGYSEDDPEYKLASIDAGYPLDLDDRSISRYGRLLNRLEARCPDADRELVGDMAVRSTELLADEGVEATILEMLGGADEALSGGNDQLRVKCSEIFASLVVLMTRGE